MQTEADQHFLHQALTQAKLRKGFTAPNPAVGAVIVKHGQIIATGTHWQAGQAHAEVAALAMLPPGVASGATLYGDLGLAAILARRRLASMPLSKRGWLGWYLPNSIPILKWQAKRAARLRSGKYCLRTVNQPGNRALLPKLPLSFAKRCMPWLCGKLALTLDGKIAGPQGSTLGDYQGRSPRFYPSPTLAARSDFDVG